MGLSIVVVALSLASCSAVSFVDEVSVDNPTAFPASVSVTDGSRSGWLPLVTLRAGSERTVTNVIDQGSTWIFRFGYARYEEELEVSRAELDRAGWSVEVPESFADALDDRNIPPPP